MKGKIKKLLLSFLLITVIIIASSPFVSAETLIMTNPYSKPQLTENNGFVELLYKNGDGSYSSCIWLWNCVDAQSSKTLVNVTINVNGVVFSPSYASGSGAFSVVYVDSSGYKEFSNILYLPGVNYTKTFGSVAVAAHVYGNYNDIIYNLPNPPITNFEIVYGGDIQLVSDVNAILEVLRSQNEAFITSQNQNTDKIIQNQQENTDKLLDAGSDVEQPDFSGTNGEIDNTVGQIESVEGSYQIDQAATQEALNSGNSFLQGTDMQRAQVQVKTWIEKFTSDNSVISGFLIAAMVLGLCFWVIGRKAGSG